MPVLLTALLFAADHLLPGRAETSEIISADSDRYLKLETGAGTFRRQGMEEEMDFLPGDRVYLRRSMILGIITGYGNGKVIYKPVETFHDYVGIAWAVALLCMVILISGSQDHRMLAGGLAMIGLLVLLLVLAVVGN